MVKDVFAIPGSDADFVVGFIRLFVDIISFLLLTGIYTVTFHYHTKDWIVNKIYLALLLVLISSVSVASIFRVSDDDTMLAELKDTPVSRYELGRFRLDLYTSMLESRMRGKQIGKTKFQFEKVEINEFKNLLQVAVTAKGLKKDQTDEQCATVISSLQPIFGIKRIIKVMWPNLSHEDNEKLQSEITLQVLLRNQNRSEMKMRCR